MSYTLFYSPGSASFAVHWMLLELGIAFEVRRVDLDAGEQHAAEYLRINPSGQVPTLVIDGEAHGESTALLMLLAERHPQVEKHATACHHLATAAALRDADEEPACLHRNLPPRGTDRLAEQLICND